ncbi:trehalose-6-phosphate synthase [Aquihabitans sp. G128]|uniref:trehalose-6-phosphate synthase n=1 Tax=Aquihabitans sp. G128 TaxID=2849779 RepID=UPI001C243767|nr:trehalose-6-phosphate synthase [Aquihabitans sp. G128]QXC59165.1 trehalose-6-phosphate synthase [Aquihabitans sp. G128]
MASERPIVIVSNRGPVSFGLDDAGSPVAKRGAGGLVSGLGPLVRGTSTLWVAAAMSDGDAVVAAQGPTTAEGFRIRLLAFDPPTFKAHYDTVCNEALWFAHHGLFDPVYEPAWEPGWVDGPWAAHRQVNEAFADAVADDAPHGAVVLVQDYHLCLMAPRLRRRRPDLRLVHFSHTPFATPLWLRTLPDAARRELVAGLAAHHACGFHTARWADDFRACCTDAGIGAPACFVTPLGPDADDLAGTIAAPASQAAAAELDELVGDRSFIVRVDRIELSKNVLRGFDAYAALLEAEPERHGRVVFGAYVYPSRAGVTAYDRYREAVSRRVAQINARFGTDTWEPIAYDPHDDYPRSMAALARADVVLVNPIRDGLNLVAKEAMLVNQRDGQLVLSPEAGAWDELGVAAWRADPFDVGATAQALADALDAPPDERRRRAGALRAASLARTPATWLADQLAAAG